LSQCAAPTVLYHLSLHDALPISVLTTTSCELTAGRQAWGSVRSRSAREAAVTFSPSARSRRTISVPSMPPAPVTSHLIVQSLPRSPATTVKGGLRGGCLK